MLTRSHPPRRATGDSATLQSQKPVSLHAKLPGTVKYKALKSIYPGFAAALNASEALAGSLEFGSCECEQMVSCLRWEDSVGR